MDIDQFYDELKALHKSSFRRLNIIAFEEKWYNSPHMLYLQDYLTTRREIFVNVDTTPAETVERKCRPTDTITSNATIMGFSDDIPVEPAEPAEHVGEHVKSAEPAEPAEPVTSVDHIGEPDDHSDLPDVIPVRSSQFLHLRSNHPFVLEENKYVTDDIHLPILLPYVGNICRPMRSWDDFHKLVSHARPDVAKVYVNLCLEIDRWLFSLLTSIKMGFDESDLSTIMTLDFYFGSCLLAFPIMQPEILFHKLLILSNKYSSSDVQFIALTEQILQLFRDISDGYLTQLVNILCDLNCSCVMCRECINRPQH